VQGARAQEPSANREAKPNIIIIMADDLGYGDTSAYEGWVDTPQLERMASEGLTFTDFHVNSSVCSPTRAAFMTGRYQQRVGIVDVIVGHRDTHGLSPEELTIPRLMKQGGYRTALFGKWHLGEPAEFNPIHHGFDEFIGYLIGAADYHNHRGSWYDGLEKKDQQGYTTHLITDNAARFIEENKSRPFFLLVAHEAVHLPFQTPADTVENRKPVSKEEMWSRERIRPKYKIMLEEMDQGVGTILNTVTRCGLAENTFVFFFSDNGAIGAGSNQPFRGGKFSHYEGGHRVPAIAWWPGRIAAGTVTNELAMGMDVLPTVIDLANIAAPKERKLDGTSMKGLLLDQADFPDRQLFFGYEPKLGTAMRDRNWKMIVSSHKVTRKDKTTPFRYCEVGS
jgi:arylsulfatase A